MIQDNAPFYAKIAPTLQAGQSIGYDLIVMTNGWQLTELINHGWLIPLDQAQLPNFAKYASPIVKSPAYDNGNKYTVAWQSGFTGIAYNPKLTDREITSIKDLWDPAFKGHVGMMSDNTELGSAGLLYLGIDPTTSTQADWKKAATVLKKQTRRRDRAPVLRPELHQGARERRHLDHRRHGRATSSRRTRPATPTSSSSCRRRGSCTGPTT